MQPSRASQLPDDAVIVRLDRGQLSVPPAVEVPPLPDREMLIRAIEHFRHACPAADDEAAQADLAFPLREHGAAARQAGSRDASQLHTRHAFASWWAKLLHGYQDHLRTVGSDPSVFNGALDAVLHTDGLLDSRAPLLRPLLGTMLQTQGLVRLLEQRASFSTRDAELVSTPRFHLLHPSTLVFADSL